MVAITKEQTYSMSEAVAVVGVQLNTLKTWLKRRNIEFSPSEIIRSGKAHRLRYRTVLRIAITWELVKFGTAPERAWFAALKFTVSGNASTGRLPGELWKEGQTYLILPHTGDCKLFNLPDGAPASMLTAHSHAAIVIHLNQFVAELQKRLAALGLRPAKAAA